MAQQKIVIAGGGFGGLFTALYLDQLPWQHKPEIIVLDRHDRFLFTPFLYELVTGELHSWEIAPYFQELLANTDIEYQQVEVTKLDIDNRQVYGKHLGLEVALNYDLLVVAVGSSGPPPGVAGAKEYALTFRTLTDAQELDRRLQLLEQSDKEKIRVCIAGGGASGVELACKVSDRLGERGRVRVVERSPYLLKNSPVRNRRAAELALQKKGVWQDVATSVVAIAPDSITLDYGNEGKDLETLPVDIVMWTVGNARHSLLQCLGEQWELEPTLQLRGYPEVFVVGDTTAGYYPATAQVAYQQAGYCAKNIWAFWHGDPLHPFTYVPLGEFMSLGIGTASMATPFLPIGINGSLASLVRRAVYLLRLPTMSHQWRVGLHWLSGWLYAKN
ncbi:MAG: NAD(P)/FAD-dependent oxidoreductase [Pseudanabaenaceae cyanobacterium]